jgi:hypothetical protein
VLRDYQSEIMQSETIDDFWSECVAGCERMPGESMTVCFFDGLTSSSDSRLSPIPSNRTIH